MQHEIGLSRAELRDRVVRIPAILANDRGQPPPAPRGVPCRAAGVDVRRVLSYASQTDETFCKRTGIAPEALVAARAKCTRRCVTSRRRRLRAYDHLSRRRGDGRSGPAPHTPQKTRRTCATCCGRGSTTWTRIWIGWCVLDLAGASKTVEPKLGWFQARLELDAVQLRKVVLTQPSLLSKSVESMDSNCDWLQLRLDLDDGS